MKISSQSVLFLSVNVKDVSLAISTCDMKKSQVEPSNKTSFRFTEGNKTDWKDIFMSLVYLSFPKYIYLIEKDHGKTQQRSIYEVVDELHI